MSKNFALCDKTRGHAIPFFETRVTKQSTFLKFLNDILHIFEKRVSKEALLDGLKVFKIILFDGRRSVIKYSFITCITFAAICTHYTLKFNLY